MNDKQKFRIYINIDTISDIQRFTEVCSTVDTDVTLKGQDENGKDWSLSAKSLLCAVVMASKFNKGNAKDLDWNTIYVECEKDIYSLLADFAK